MSGNKNLQYMEISKIGTVISGSTPKTKVKEFWDGNITWLTPLDLKNGRKYIFNGARRITEKAIKSTSLKLVPKGTVLLTSRAPIGKIAIAGKELCTNQGFKNIICSEQVNNEYLYYYLRSKTEFLNNLGRGATFKEISKKIVESIIIPLPPLETQKKIADILDNIQKFITLRKKQIEKWDEFVKGVFLEMFGDPVRNNKGWTTNLIMNCVKPVKKKNMKNYPNEKIRYIDISSIDNVRNKITGYIKHTGETAPSRAQQIVNYGDILISTVRPNLKNVALIEYDYDNLIASTGFCVLRTNESINNRFLFQLVKLDSFTNILIKITTGANYPAVKNSDIYNQHIILPPLDLQNKFAALVEKTEKQKELMEKSLSAMETLFNGIAQKAFRGELFN